jgi:hypothetical protein
MSPVEGVDRSFGTKASTCQLNECLGLRVIAVQTVPVCKGRQLSGAGSPVRQRQDDEAADDVRASSRLPPFKVGVPRLDPVDQLRPAAQQVCAEGEDFAVRSQGVGLLLGQLLGSMGVPYCVVKINGEPCQAPPARPSRAAG